MAPVEIAIPARPEYVAVVRLALASLARNAGADEELVDEMKIAISEALTSAVVADAEGNAPVTVTWDADEGTARITISHPPAGDEEARDVDTQGFSTRAAMSEALLKSLVDDYEVERGADATTVRMRFSLEGSPAA